MKQTVTTKHSSEMEIKTTNFAKKEKEKHFQNGLNQSETFEEYAKVKAYKARYIPRKVPAIKVLNFLRNMKDTFHKALDI